MAEASVVPAAAAIPVPDGTDPAVAALIGCCVTTGVGAVLKTAAVPAGASVAVIGLGGVGLSCVMGAVVAGASRIVAIDRVPAKLDAALAVGATDVLLAGDDAAATIEALRDVTDGGPDYIFEAIGRVSTAELAIAALPVGGTAVLVGMTPLGARAAFDVYPFVDGSRRILGSNYGFAEPADRLPAIRGVVDRGPAAGRTAHRPPDRARRHRGRLRRDARAGRTRARSSPSTERRAPAGAVQCGRAGAASSRLAVDRRVQAPALDRVCAVDRRVQAPALDRVCAVGRVNRRRNGRDGLLVRSLCRPAARRATEVPWAGLGPALVRP